MGKRTLIYSLPNFPLEGGLGGNPKRFPPLGLEKANLLIVVPYVNYIMNISIMRVHYESNFEPARKINSGVGLDPPQKIEKCSLMHRSVPSCTKKCSLMHSSVP